ncbi:hypothetical protein [Mycobacterium sp. MMS18-G62]
MSLIGRHAAQLGSSVMMLAGPLSLALANPKSLVDVGDDGVLPPSFVTEIVTAAVTPMTASNATAPSPHFQPLPRFFGGGPGDHGCCGHGCCGGPP